MKNKFFILRVVFSICSIALPYMSLAEEPEVKNTAKRELFSIQVETTTSKDQAQASEKSLIQNGYPAYIEEAADSAGRTVYQVRIGSYLSRSRAETEGRAFYKKEKKPYWITAVNSGEAAPDSAAATKPEGDAETEKVQREAGAGTDEAVEQAPIRAGIGDAGTRDEPAAVTRIYTYRNAQGYLGMTNNPEKIPLELRYSVESISVFPVTYVSFNQKKKVLTLEIEKIEQQVKLLGIRLPSSAVVEEVAAYCDKNLKAVPLRLKFTPVRDTKNTAPLAGTILLKQGTLINLELVRLGIAPCADEDLSGQFKKDCRDAEQAARSSRAGIWAGTGWQ
jgi:hypothetical protein